MTDPPRTDQEADQERDEPALLLFLLLTIGGSWLAAASLFALIQGPADAPLVTRLLATSLVYGATMGWQPLVASLLVQRWLGGSLLRGSQLHARGALIAVGALLALGLVSCAALLAWAGGLVGLPAPGSLHGAPEPELAGLAPSPGAAAALLLAFLAAALSLWIQCLSEELGWRGFFLERLMRALGPTQGLLLHGAVWGLWYAPLLVYAGPAPGPPARLLVGAVLTCMLLGVFLGGLRLAFHSLVPALVANLTITLAAGLPYVLHGVDAGLRGAVFGPAGWVAAVGLSGALFAVRRREIAAAAEEL